MDTQLLWHERDWTPLHIIVDGGEHRVRRVDVAHEDAQQVTLRCKLWRSEWGAAIVAVNNETGAASVVAWEMGF